MFSPSAVPTLTEAEVQHLCGHAHYARATALQAAGHVLRPRLTDLTLSADVRGTWRRIDHAQVEVGRQLKPGCSCALPAFCGHVGALLLHWVRAPSSFEVLPGASSLDSAFLAAAPAEPATPQTELARDLNTYTLERLREIASRRGVRLSARLKADVTAELAAGLGDPANLEAALSELSRAELRALQATCLVADPAATSPAIQVAYERTGGSGAVELDGLLDLGLVVDTGRDWQSSLTIKVPRLVEARLPVWPGLVRVSERRAHDLRASDGRVGIVDLLVILSHAFRDGLPRRPLASADGPTARGVPAGWEIDPTQVRETPRSPLDYLGPEVTLVPVGLLPDEEVARLVAQTGQSTRAVTFGMELLVTLGLVTGSRRLELQDDRWQTFITGSADDRLAQLCGAWLRAISWSELALLAGVDGPFQFRGRLGSYVDRVPFLLTHTAGLRRLVARVVGVLVPEVWYDVASLIATIDRLAPAALSAWVSGGWSQQTLHQLSLGLFDRGDPPRPLALDQPRVRSRVDAALVIALLEGPFSWLGLVEVATNRGAPRAFLVHPWAGVLLGRPIRHASAGPARLVVGDDGTIVVPAGMTDVSVQSLLARVGELLDSSAAGLRYRLTAERAQVAFEDGLRGPELVRFLEECCATPLPTSVRSRLERWWAGYGTVRLYDELTLVELSAEVLPAEILAAAPLLRQHIVHALSPRLLAVDPAATDALIAELVRLGYAPKVMDSRP